MWHIVACGNHHAIQDNRLCELNLMGKNEIRFIFQDAFPETGSGLVNTCFAPAFIHVQPGGMVRLKSAAVLGRGRKTSVNRP